MIPNSSSSSTTSPSAEDGFELRSEQNLTALIEVIDFSGRNDAAEQHEKPLLRRRVEDLLEMLHQLERIFLQMILVEISDEIFPL